MILAAYIHALDGGYRSRGKYVVTKLNDCVDSRKGWKPNLRNRTKSEKVEHWGSHSSSIKQDLVEIDFSAPLPASFIHTEKVSISMV